MTESIRAGLDTNILVYAAGFDDPERQKRAVDCLVAFGPARTIISWQVIGEYYNVMVRRMRLTGPDASARAKAATRQHVMMVSTEATCTDALDLASTHQLQFWDALILATAANAGCSLLLSEDMADGFVWKGCTVANPFLDRLHPLLSDALGGAGGLLR